MPSDLPIQPVPTPEPPGPPRDRRPLWRRSLPFVTAIALVGFLLCRLDLARFVQHLQRVNYAAFIGFVALFNLALLTADAFATSYVYRRTVCPIRFREFWLIRGFSYLPSLLNHHVGQAWLTWYLSRAYKAPLWRVAGATLLVYATTFGSLFLFMAMSLFFPHEGIPWLAPTVALGAVAGLAYLAVIRIAPPFLASKQMLSPLFEVGVRGHIEALVLRLPHMVVLFLGSWLPFHFFGVDIPPGVAFAYVPVLMVVVALPITPQGVGTRDWFCMHYFSRYAPGSAEDQAAAIAATTLTFVVALTILQIIGSLLLMRRALAMLAPPPPAPSD